jgi:CRISPR-associated protein Csm2
MPFDKKLKEGTIQALNGLDDKAIEWAQLFGEYLATNDQKELKQLSTSQLRKFFGQLKRIQAEGYNEKKVSELLMLKPQLAYAVGRDIKNNRNQTKITDFEKHISPLIGEIKEKQHFNNFVNLIEAIVAYHKAKGGQ